jgi:hypothetical protein
LGGGLIIMTQFQSAESSKQQAEECRMQDIQTQISVAIKQGKLEVEVSVEYLTNSIINKLTASGYSILGGLTIKTKTVSWA